MLEACLKDVVSAARTEVDIDSGLTYDGLTPVQVHVSKRERRYRISDEGAGADTAGVGRSVSYPDHIAFGEYSVNVTRQGVVWLPAVAPCDEWLTTLCGLVAKGSVALYELLLELDERDERP